MQHAHEYRSETGETLPTLGDGFHRETRVRLVGVAARHHAGSLSSAGADRIEGERARG